MIENINVIHMQFVKIRLCFILPAKLIFAFMILKIEKNRIIILNIFFKKNLLLKQKLLRIKRCSEIGKVKILLILKRLNILFQGDVLLQYKTSVSCRYKIIKKLEGK